MNKKTQFPMSLQEPPTEFLPETVKANSPESEQLFTHLLKADEARQSFIKQDFAFRPSPSGDENGVDLNDDSLYYNTQGSAKDYWKKNGPLPVPTKDISQLRHEFREFGYCLIEDAVSQEQLNTMRTRVVEQAAGERLAGVAFWYSGGAGTGKTTHAQQFVTCLVNKGDCFRGFMEHDPSVVQGGPLIEQLVSETVDPDFRIMSLLAIIANKGGHPQALHQDSGFFQTETPILANHLVFLDNVNYWNGGTLIVPQSHKIMYEGGNHQPVGELPPAISLEAKAGTIMLMDGRVLHGTGVNQTDKPRHILSMSCIKPWIRTQELHVISLKPEVLATASRKLLQRLGFIGNGLGGIEGHGQEPGILRGVRQVIDEENYVRIGELSPSSSKEELTRDYTWRSTTTGRRAAMNQPERRDPPEKLWESKDPLEQTPVNARHQTLQEATRSKMERH